MRLPGDPSHGCPHPVAFLVLHRVPTPQAGYQHVLMCDRCGKNVPIPDSDVFLWLKLLEVVSLLRSLVNERG